MRKRHGKGKKNSLEAQTTLAALFGPVYGHCRLALKDR
jgi:hypothetical protein